jgi:Ca2+-binding EF-hand superfamily protein
MTVADPQLPNLEEWASLSVLVNADVCEGDIYGVRLKDFIEGLCEYSVSAAQSTRLRSGERLSVEQVSRELQRQIYVEALNCGKGKKPDFHAVFDIFDENKNGEISLAEFKVQLRRLQLVNKLAEHQLPTLLGMFTKSKHQVKYEDFVAFALKGNKQGGGLDASDEEKEKEDADDEDDQDLEDMTSNVPPLTITRNADCDWLLWHLYREARKVDPMDPEGVITELQNRCAETEHLQSKDPAISVKEMWNHLFELGLQGGMTAVQFLKGVQLVCRDGNGKDDDRVDYDALCKYTIRMGRSFNSLVQQRSAEDEGKFAPMLLELKKYFKDLSQEKYVRSLMCRVDCSLSKVLWFSRRVPGSDEKAGVARYEKIFRRCEALSDQKGVLALMPMCLFLSVLRMDTDGDGMLTVKEFKSGLKKLHYKSVKAWNLRMVRRLFDECDKNRDGLLSIKEFSNYVQDADAPERLALADKAKSLKQNPASEGRFTPGKGSKENKLALSDDEEDEVFHRNKVLTDHQLLRKVHDTLMDVVPVDPHGPGRHAEVVRGSVRRFFQRADPEHRGTVSEERFRAFLR